MTAKEARAISETVQQIPLGMRHLLREIKRVAEEGKMETICREIKPTYKEWLEKNGYSVTETDAVFFAGSPSQKAVKITW